VKLATLLGHLSHAARLPLAILLFGLTVLGGLWLGVLQAVHQQRTMALDQAARDSANLLVAFREHIGRTLTGLDQIMLAIKAEHTQSPDRFTLPTWLDNSAFLNGVAVQVSMVDAAGIVRANDRGLVREWIDVSDRPHFRHHLNPAAVQPYVSVPVLGRVSGRWTIQITRRLERADGTFDGVVAVSLDPAYLSQFFETAGLGPHGVVALIGDDGIVRARRAGGNSDVGQDISAGRLGRTLLAAGQGKGRHRSVIDGIERTYSASAVAGYPLSVVVGLGVADVLAAAEAGRHRSLAMGVVLSAVVAIFVALLLREVGLRRRRDEAAAAQAELLATILELTPAAITVKDEIGRLKVINEASRRFYDRPREDILGRRSSELLPSDVADKIEAADAAARAAPDQTIKGERHLTIGGEARCVFSARRACTVAGRQLLITSASDVTALRQAEAAMRRAVAAEEASRIKSEFLANMSHELRTPLNAVIGFSEILNREMFGPLGNERYREYAADILATGTHLLDVVNDILDFSKAEAGEITFTTETADLGVLLRGVGRMVQERVAAGGLVLSVQVPDDLSVTADVRRLRQVLLNLLSNAIKFTASGGTIALSACRAPGGRIAIDVTDTGIGMAPGEIAVALTPFRQLDSSFTRRHEGTGLGLPLAKRLVDLMGGDLAIDSAVGRGTRIRIEFPEGGNGTPAAVPQVEDGVPNEVAA
jgi:PAS domain S-box-containing protein